MADELELGNLQAGLDDLGRQSRATRETVGEVSTTVGELRGLYEDIVGTGPGGSTPSVVDPRYPEWVNPRTNEPVEQQPIDVSFVMKAFKDKMNRYPNAGEAAAMVALPDTAGVAPDGAVFESLPVEAQRRVMASRVIQARLRFANEPVRRKGTVASLFAEQERLGWCNPGRADCRASGTPQVYRPDENEAVMRLYMATLGVRGPNAMEEQVQVEHWSKCLAPGQDTIECLRAHEDQPGATEALQNLLEPWRATAQQDKLVQVVTGIDGVKYLVVGKGTEKWGIKLSLAITLGISTSVALGLATIGGSYFLFRTESGKALMAKLKGG